ncbi:MAG: nucleotidyltransferase domain-containing protein [Oscillospiraceae bacterium]|jgi:predicted nucleotidyltransferase|nr:nucleotidyltransferase domain-containing protein [Oscillospiraceae bacterium]
MLEFNEIRRAAERLAEEYPIKSLACFGSYANGTQTRDSDIDFLVEFVTPAISLIKLSGLKLKLEEQLGVKVDLIHVPIPDDSYITVNNEVLIYERP